jgi:hypothetical protein
MASTIATSKRPTSERAQKVSSASALARGGGIFTVWVPPAVVDTCGALYLHVDAPPEAVKAVCRVLAKTAHPNVGGNPEEMKVLNEAYKTALEWAELVFPHLI